MAAFSLCLLAQAYEHASNLLTIFAELEITVALLIQIDKLVQLLESPSLRAPAAAARAGALSVPVQVSVRRVMLLPQSSAFVTLRNRLNA